MNKKKLRPDAALLSLLAVFMLTGSDLAPLEEWGRFSRSAESRVLLAWLKENAALILDREPLKETATSKLPELNGRAGLFITLIKGGKVRGCYGAFHHDSSLVNELFLRYLKGALFLDPRYRPLEPAELNDTEIVITITSFPEPVEDINNVDISSFGLFIECESLTGTVVVPAEFRTLSKIKGLTGKSDCRYSQFRAVTIR